jgi:hypothetical protein
MGSPELIRNVRKGNDMVSAGLAGGSSISTTAPANTVEDRFNS